MFKALAEPAASVVRQLADAVGTRLKSAEFCDFVAVLDLSQTGSLGRAALERGVRAGAAELLPGRGADSARRLFDLVRREALPESGRDGIRAADVLAALGVADPVDLYPAPTRLAELVGPLPAPGAAAVADAVRAHSGGFVVAHGPAGSGKTTALRQIGDHLPPGSVVVLFDCYGGGEYLNSGEERHPPQRFVMQVVNDLAQLCGTSLLVEPPLFEEDLWRRLRRTLEGAVGVLAPGALLVLAVDAADNAAFAAAQRGDRGFLAGLVGLPLPERVSVVMTARSHRVESLGAASAARVPLAAFDVKTSAAHLRRYHSDASDADAVAFHESTAGNPRTQYYALSQSADGQDLRLLLESCRRTPDALFQDLVDSALQVCGADAGGRRWLGLMLALARPVSTATLAAALDVDLSAVAAFADGLAPGVTVVDGAIRFRDEDFENYVRGRVDPADVAAAHDRLAEMFLATRGSDADAAAHVADHLFAARRFGDLLQIVLDEDWPAAIPDGFRRGQVQGRRLDLAARAVGDAGDAAAAVRLAVRACETASRLNTLSVLVDSHLDLVARYADVDMLRAEMLRHARNGGWLAPTHMRMAVALAREPGRHQAARTELERADAWLRRWSTGPREETRTWDVSVQDVANAAEARYRLDGAEAAIAWLRRWRPLRFALDAAAELAKRVAAEEGPAAVRDALHANRVPAVAQAPFLAYAGAASTPPDPAWLDEVVTAVVTRNAGEQRPWHYKLTDIAMRHGDRSLAASLAQRWIRPLPSYRYEFNSGGADGVAALRIHAIAAVLSGATTDLADLVPQSLQPPTNEDRTRNTAADDSRAQARREWTEIVQPLWEAAQIAVHAAIAEADATDIAAFVTSGLAGRLDKANHRWFTYDRSYPAWAAILAEAAIDVAATPDVVKGLADEAPKLVRDGAPDLWLDLADILIRGAAHEDLALDLCRRAAEQAVSRSVRDRIDLLARAATIASRVNPELGRRLFDNAVDAANGINDEGARLLAVHADLATRATLESAAKPTVATKILEAANRVAPHVTEAAVIPYERLAQAAGQLDPGTAFAAISRWDDEGQVPIGVTLPAVLVGAAIGGGISAAQALCLDHLIDDDNRRLQCDLQVIDRLRARAGGIGAARIALRRTSEWLRRDVPAGAQPDLASYLLDWAAERGLDEHIRPTLDPVIRLAHDKADTSERWLDRDPTADVQELLDNPTCRGLDTLTSDVAKLSAAYIYGSRLTAFVVAVVQAVPSGQRIAALEAVERLPDRVSAEVIVAVLSDCLHRWRDWPGVLEWANAALPRLLGQHLSTLAWRSDTTTLLAQLRAFGSDGDIRLAVLAALPEARPRLTPDGWQNIAALLGQLCDPTAAGAALTALLADQSVQAEPAATNASAATPDPIARFLWSAFGHPRRSIRWRAAHATRDLLTRGDTESTALAAALVDCLDHTDPGPYRDPSLHFYRFSAAAALLVALARVAADKPHVVAPHLQDLTRHATSRDLPHVQIRELARQTALAVATPDSPDAETLRSTNQPTAVIKREKSYTGNDRSVSENRRYRFDSLDTIPYWYAPLGRVFGLPVDAIAERAERWILDEWGLAEADWWTDRRELRDQHSYRRTGHRHGSIPPEENLRLYIEYHAMLTTAGELIDAQHPVYEDPWDDAPEPWSDWLREHLPANPRVWVSDLRSPIPAEPDLFGHLPPFEEWENASEAEFDAAVVLADGRLPNRVIVAGHTDLRRRDGYGQIYIKSALVAPAHAADLQRALAAAINPTDWKLPDENEDEFEVVQGPFILRGWLTDPGSRGDTLDEHDPYAHDIHPELPLPGTRFRDAVGVTPDRNPLTLRRGSAVVVDADQWADPELDDKDAITSSGYRVCVDRDELLRYLADSGMVLIVEVQIGRHRSNSRSDDYRPPRSRIYLIDSAGSVTVN